MKQVNFKARFHDLQNRLVSVFKKPIPYADEYWDQVLPLLFQSPFALCEAIRLPRSEFGLLRQVV